MPITLCSGGRPASSGAGRPHEQRPDQGDGRTELVLGEPPGGRAEGAGVMRLDDQGVHRVAEAGRIAGDGLKRLGVTSARLVSGPGAV